MLSQTELENKRKLEAKRQELYARDPKIGARHYLITGLSIRQVDDLLKSEELRETFRTFSAQFADNETVDSKTWDAYATAKALAKP